MSFFSSPWFVGIATGLVSGVITVLIVRGILPGEINKQYLARVNQANDEMIYALRLIISEQSLPARNVLMALISATAIKHNIKAEDMYTINSIINILIKEVMDTNFISSADKVHYCNVLIESKKANEGAIWTEADMEEQKPLKGYHKRDNIAIQLGFLLGIMIGMFVMIFLLVNGIDALKLDDSMILPIVISVLGMSAITILIVTVYRQIKRIKIGKKQDVTRGDGE